MNLMISIFSLDPLMYTVSFWDEGYSFVLLCLSRCIFVSANKLLNSNWGTLHKVCLAVHLPMFPQGNLRACKLI